MTDTYPNTQLHIAGKWKSAEAGETIDVTFEQAGDYEFQCDPHAGAGMKGVIHVQ